MRRKLILIRALLALCLGFPHPSSAWASDPNTSTTGQSAAELATPVQLPYDKILPGAITDYAILKFMSSWGHEYLMQPEFLPQNGYRYVQKAGRSCERIKPFWMLYNTKTNKGIAVALAWSGNWLIDISPRDGQVLLHVTTSPSPLQPFERINGLPIPGALVSEFTGHWDYGSQPIVRFIRNKLRRDMGKNWPPVQFNTWYDGVGRFDEKNLRASAAAAAETGCELFTVDAGWYGGESGGDWNTGLGDWTVNKTALPHGLEAVASKVRQLGMKFGLWVEIECAAPNTPVAKAHPDWFLRDGKRPLSNRAALDFGKPEVVAWAKSVIDDLMNRYRLDYLKMDFNTNLGVDGESITDGRDPLYSHYRGLVELWKYIREKHPQLIVENCSSGSLRQDMMTAALSDTHWVSDNVDNPWNMAMNFGASYLFPPEICSHWTVKPKGDQKTMDDETVFTANMMGHLGLSGRISLWNAKTRQIASERIAFYKKIRPLLCKADVYHLTEPTNPSQPRSAQAALYLDPTTGNALLFAFHAGDPAMEKTVPLRGLHADRQYDLVMPADYGPKQTLPGKELIEHGLNIKFPHAGASVIIQLNPETPVSIQPMSEMNENAREIIVEKKLLHFPVKEGAKNRLVTIAAKGVPVRRFDIELADGDDADWWAPLDVSSWAGQRLSVVVDKLPVKSQALAFLRQSDTLIGSENLYREALRPQFHFSAQRGWINDPNGLAVFNGEYHLFYQHNPYGWRWGNMHWGHATSCDLIHWQEHGEVLYPDELGVMFSGCAVVDRNNTSGFGRDGKPPLVLIYTAAGPQGGQCIASSTDGRTFTKLDKNPVIKNFVNGNRDPKVFWHEPTKKWVMVLYGEPESPGSGLTSEGKPAAQHTVYFFTSPNLRDWTSTSTTVKGGIGDDKFLYECPDLFELPVDGDPSNKKWVLTAANADYAIGTFDGTKFTQETKRLRGHSGRGFYAAQTYSDVPDGRRIQIGWLQAPSPGMPFNQAMSLPVELKLRSTPEGPRLTRQPVKELESLRHEPGQSGALADFCGDLIELCAEFEPGDTGTVEFNVRGAKITYDAKGKEIIVNGMRGSAPLLGGQQRIRVFADRTMLEVFASDGLTYMSIPFIPRKEDQSVSVDVKGGKMNSLQVYKLKSIWEHQ